MSNSSRLSVMCDRIIEAGWLAAVVLVPLFFNIYSSRVFEPDKLTLLRSIALIMAAAWIVRTLEERASSTRGGGKPSLTNGVNLRTPLVLPTLVLVVVYVVATLLSITPYTSLFGSYQRLQGTYTTFSYIVVFVMILQGMRRRRQLDRLVTAVVMTSMPIAFYALLQRGDGVTSLDPLPWGGNVTARVAANMGNAIFVAAYLIMAFFLTLGRIIEAFRIILKEAEARWSDILRASAYIFVGAVQLIAFSFANSRGPLLGFMPGMFIFGLVGLLMLRVTLHSAGTSAASNGNPTPTAIENASAPSAHPVPSAAASNQIGAIDVLKALALSIVSIAAAGGAGLLAYKGFPGTPQVTLAAVVALVGGLVPLIVVVGIRRTAARWVWAAWIFFTIVGAVGLFLVNFSDHPKMVELRGGGAFGTLGTLLESEGGTGKVRSLIWQGSVELVGPHDPISFPEGGPDPLNAIRPLIGYGPEAMYVAYNRFYPPDLAHYELRNASPDRSHNETWDSLVITGGVGFVAEQFLFLSVFFYALKLIGWVPNRRAASLLVGLMVAGGIAGAAGLGATIGTNFMGAGWPGGVTAGLVVYVILFALFHFQISARVYAFVALVLIAIIDLAIFGATFTSANRIRELLAATGGGIAAFAVLYFVARWAFGQTAGQPIAVSGHVFLIIALFGGMLGHYLEISLAGIAIASTRTYFWTFAALLVVTGLNRVPADDPAPAPAPVQRPAPAPTPKIPPANAPRHKKKKAAATPARTEPRPSLTRTPSNWLGPTVAMALIGALILGTLGYEFITAPPPAPNIPAVQGVTDLITRALTRLPYQENRESPGTLLMIVVTWVFGAVIALTELRRRDVIKPGTQLKATFTYAGVSIGVTFVYWLLHGSQLIGALSLLPSNQAASVNAFVDQFTVLAEAMAGLLGLFYVLVFTVIAAIGLSLVGENQARSLPLASSIGLFSSAPIALVALVLLVSTNFNAIRADIIFKQGQPYVNNNACNGSNGQCDIAVAHLKQALKYAPNEDFYMLSLGASFLNKSAAAADTPASLVESSTYDSIFKFDAEQTSKLGRRDALAAARITLIHAREINPLNTDHSANLARLYRRWSDLAADDTERQQRLDQASKFYEEATRLSPNSAQLWNEWAVVYFSLWDLAKRIGNTSLADQALQNAQVRLDRSLKLDDQFIDTYRYLASLYSAQGRTAEAEATLKKVYDLNPDNGDDWGRLAEQYLTTGNITEAERLAVDFLDRHPDYLAGWRYLARRIYYPQNKLAEALSAGQTAVNLSVSANDSARWEDQLWLAQVLGQTGNLQEAMRYAQDALASAPEDRKTDVQNLINAIQNAQKGSTPTPTPAPTP